MARGISSLLTSAAPHGTASAEVTIGHVQLRDVLICPHDQGVVCYPQGRSIVEHDLANAEVDRITTLAFTPNSLSTLNIPDTHETLLAAGGQEAELHLSLYSPPSHSLAPLVDAEGPDPLPLRGFGKQQWCSEVLLEQPASINNSVHLTSLSLSPSHESSVEPRVIISNNDKTVKFYDVAIRAHGSGLESSISPNHRMSSSARTIQRLSSIGQLKLDVPVNHSSISPDGRTLLSVGDSPEIFLHRISGGSRVTFSPISVLSLSSYINTPSYLYNPHTYANSAVAASFSTAFSANGSKFAVASQEGVVVVWDVRSTKPLKVIQTDKARRPERSGNGGASGWIVDGPWDWSRGMGNAPGWGVRSVKFSPNGVGREVMVFTEHTSVVHVLDARTFETEEVVRVPNFEPSRSSTTRPRSRSSSPPIRVMSASPSHDLLPPPPPRILMFSGAVEDAFRIPISEPGTRRRRHARRVRGAGRDEDSPVPEEDPDLDGIVVIPPLGDADVENDVRRLLGRRTSHARTRSLHTPTFSSQDDPRDFEDLDPDRDEEMDVDDYDADCLSSHTPSRASSPALPSPSITATGQTQSAPSSTVRLPMPTHIADHPLRLSRPSLHRTWRELRDPYSRLSSARSPSWRHRRNTQSQSRTYAQREEDEESLSSLSAASSPTMPDAEQDLAGICFDPSGEFVYVASTKGVCSWKIRGAEKSWWAEPAWA